ncbi:MAG TPA: hypothetical protein VFA97_03065 [Gaiellaceae bacterium]|nr:hypothetical protein [Gaiellaceae bacterium]
MDERAGRCVERLVVDGERRAAADDDVELFVSAALAVPRYERPARVVRPGVRAECA